MSTQCRLFVAMCLITVFSGCGSPSDRSSPDAQALLRRVSDEGAAQVVRSLAADAGAWDYVMTRIASGTTEWVDVGLALRKGSDAGATSELHSALFLALGKNPAYILRQANEPPYLLAAICGGRVDPPDSYDAAVAEIRTIRDAVRQIAAAELTSKRDECASKLQEGEVALTTMFGVKNETSRE